MKSKYLLKIRNGVFNALKGMVSIVFNKDNLHLSNEVFGQGNQTIVMSPQEAIDMLQELSDEIRKHYGFKEETVPVSTVIKKVKEAYREGYSEAEYHALDQIEGANPFEHDKEHYEESWNSSFAKKEIDGEPNES